MLVRWFAPNLALVNLFSLRAVQCGRARAAYREQHCRPELLLAHFEFRDGSPARCLLRTRYRPPHIRRRFCRVVRARKAWQADTADTNSPQAASLHAT